MHTIYYVVQYRNMHTAIHGLLCYETVEEAEAAYEQIQDELENAVDELEYECVLNEIVSTTADVYEWDPSEIDWRDVYQDDDDGQFYYDVNDDERVLIVNTAGIAHDLYM